MKRYIWICVLLSGCMVGPDYKRPDSPISPEFKEIDGWIIAHPADELDKGAWWSVYRDPELDRLERMVEVSNQTVKAAEAQFRDASALVAQAQAGLFPVVSLTPGVTRGSSRAGGGAAATTYSLSETVTWNIDVWGRIRRQVESNAAGAEVSAADLANAKLSAQATLAADYFDLRAEDALAELLRETVANYRRALSITQNQYRAGTTSSIDYVTALAQLQTAEAQFTAVGLQRQKYEHAIAVLTGHAPADLTIAPAPLATEVPVLPPGLPAQLLQRRPDIAAAERVMRQQNALIGVQIAGYYPVISLSALGEYAGNPLSKLFSAANQIWSLGASASQSVFNGGLTGANVSAARATYDAAVATYRQTVLTGLQQVEDALSDLRILEAQSKAQAIAVTSTERAVNATINAYRAGTVSYTSVITEQTQLLANKQTALAIQQSRLVASVSLIQALGGGWTATDLRSGRE